MKEEYIVPFLEVVDLTVEDILTESGDDGDDCGGENELPCL